MNESWRSSRRESSDEESTILSSDSDSSPKPSCSGIHKRKSREKRHRIHNAGSLISDDEEEASSASDEEYVAVSSTSEEEQEEDKSSHCEDGNDSTQNSLNNSNLNLIFDKGKHDSDSQAIPNAELNNVIEISTDEEGAGAKSKSCRKHGLTPHPSNLTHERQRELVNAKKFLENELIKENSALQSMVSSKKSIEMKRLPDKGAKLRSSIEKQISKVKELNTRLSHVNSNIVDLKSHSAERNSTNNEDNIKDLNTLVEDIRKNSDFIGLGEKAIKAQKERQAQTVEAVEKLHKFLRTSDVEYEATDPKSLKVPLLPHQRVALAWLLRRESAFPPGGILADDMGLGKTLTIISLILKDNENSRHSTSNSSEEDEEAATYRKKFPIGNTLVVCPSSVVGQWASEVSTKVKPVTVSIYTHHGPKRETHPRSLAHYDIVLTTYSILQHENKDKPGPLLGVNWKRVVLDEAHLIRNYKSKTAQAVFALRARRRWALTGTPIHNKEGDYFSLLKFLKCKPFDDIVIWKQMIENAKVSGMERLHLVTKSLLLRRTKEEIQAGGGLKTLKDKQFLTIDVKLDPEEKRVYARVSLFSSALLAQYIYERSEKDWQNGVPMSNDGPRNPFADKPELGRIYKQIVAKNGGVKTHYILVLLLRLRQICCHPYLVSTFIENESIVDGIEDNDGNDLALIDQMVNLSIVEDDERGEPSRKLISSDDPVFKKDRCSSKLREVLKCITNILNNGNDKLIVVSQWKSVLDILKTFLNAKTVSLDGTIPVKDRRGIIEDFNTNKHGPRVMLLSLTAGGTGLNLIGANHLLLVDVHWNPQLEAQACDRIYRVGQSKKVYIYKFVCSNTIEERIVKLQTEKLEIAKKVLTGSGNVQNAKLTLRDLKILFDVK